MQGEETMVCERGRDSGDVWNGVRGSNQQSSSGRNKLHVALPFCLALPHGRKEDTVCDSQPDRVFECAVAGWAKAVGALMELNRRKYRAWRCSLDETCRKRLTFVL
eukprot:755372-Hanusia_phi.AAC.2